MCGEIGAEPFFTAEAVPVFSVALWETREEARDCPKGNVALGGCPSCGFIYNCAFDPALTGYDATYENALHFSKVYREYANREAEALVDRYDLRNKKVVDIGCGDGQFLSLLCQLGGNSGVGYDPSFVADNHAGPLHPNARIEMRYYTEEDMRQGVDLIVSRQVLEHIPDPLKFLSSLRRGLEGQFDTVLAFEVPNAEYLIRDLSVWDIIYEHCNFFTEPSLRRVFERSGFEVHDIHEGFGGLNLTVESSPSPQTEPAENSSSRQRAAAVAENVSSFGERAKARIAEWNSRLRGWRRSGQRVAVWGAGARVAMFLNMVDAVDAVGIVVDINPRKEGFYLPGTGHQIGAPGKLIDFAPETVLLMNPNYKDEVRGSLRELGVMAELLVA